MGSRLCRCASRCRRASSGNADAGTQENDVVAAAPPLPGSSDAGIATPGMVQEEQEQSVLELDDVQIESPGHGVTAEPFGLCEFGPGGWYRPFGATEWMRWRSEDDVHDDEDWASSVRGSDDRDEQQLPKPQEPENHE
eukprot:TRINITY_DN100128_c0_g1_i1.p1 TRINITY_DN100128_c0_g1~~TRINITY_DN100128_c0_g1_i1.p1  ORF type:complete len:138 (+),score=19.75 TRINITY_DN100128_c0_g1_i1:73-486(+)